ncbi:MAG: HEPN domain-containing protein [bacterium]|nr:HEPN domain-containing protein [bacterium]
MDEPTKKLIEGYLEKSKGKLKVAEKLLADGFYDDAISRAYYAVFHAAQAALLIEGAKAETHKGVVMLFGLLLVKTGKIDRKYGKFLSNLKDDRETGDYEVLSWMDEEDAQNAVTEAEEFIKIVERFIRDNLV